MKWLSLILAIIAFQGGNCQTSLAAECEFVENCRSGYYWDAKTCFCERVGMSRPTCDIVLECAAFFKFDPVTCVCVAIAQAVPIMITIPPPTRPPRPTGPLCIEKPCTNGHFWSDMVSFK